jgi:hypothetical protein
MMKLAEFRINLPSYLQPDDVFAELIRHFNIQRRHYQGTYVLSPTMRDVTLAVHLARFFLRGLQ